MSVDGAERLTARWWRAPSAAVRFALSPPGARGCAPLPPDPYPRQAELAGFCALRARAALRAGCFVLAHVATRMFVLAHAATRPLALTPLVHTTLVCFSAAVCLAPRIAARLLH